MNKTKTILMSALVAVAMTACDTDSKNERTFSFPMANYAAQAGGEAAFSNSATTTRIDYENSLGEINYPTISLPNMSSGSMKISGLKLSSLPKGEGLQLSGTGVTPVVNGATSLGSANVTAYFKGYNGYYMIDFADGTSVTSFSIPLNYFSTTTVTSADQNPYTTNTADKNRYSVIINAEKKTANIDILAASFAEKMPSMSLRFKDVKVFMDKNSVTLEADELIPVTYNSSNLEDPQPKYKITNLKAHGTPEHGMSLTFECAGTFHVTAALVDVYTNNQQ
ncbi:hypothetical protein [uncultured Muribaculum sp.]|uniref:hypothetical protein n=1 Tax=uncultured Muribaculum sp. TaxID=1918613 RepID=UPI0025B637E0|nr:hypothetical protein [uncultured Muribaculum sp.]